MKVRMGGAVQYFCGKCGRLMEFSELQIGIRRPMRCVRTGCENRNVEVLEPEFEVEDHTADCGGLSEHTS